MQREGPPRRRRQPKRCTLLPGCSQKNARTHTIVLRLTRHEQALCHSLSIRRSNSRSASAISLLSTFAFRKLRLTVNGNALSFTCQVKFFGRPAFFGSGFAV